MGSSREFGKLAVGGLLGALVTVAAVAVGLPVAAGWGAAILLGVWLGSR